MSGLGCLRCAGWLAVVWVSGLAFAQTPTVTPFDLLTGDDHIGGALSNPNSPVIARGGNSFLAVWSDQRSKLGESATQSDIFGMRLDASGSPLDPVAIKIGQTYSEERTPRVCWNGTDWLVTWIAYGNALVAARVSASGELRDDPPLTLMSTGQAGYNVGTDGSNWVVVTSGTTANDVGVRGFRISSSGVVLDPAGVLIPTTTPSYSVPPIGYIAGANGGYLYCYTMWNSSDTTADDVMAVRLNANLAAIGQPFYVSQASGNQTVAGLASNDSGFFVLFNGQGAEYYITDLWGARVSTQGAVLDPAGINLSRGNSPLAYSLASRVEWNGTHYVAMWAYNGIATARVRTDGVLLDPGGRGIANITASEICVGTDGGFQAVALGNATTVTTTHISSSLVAGAAAVISTGAPSQYANSLANNGATWMLAFLSATVDGIAVKAQALGADGAALTAEPVALGTGSASTISAPRLAWNGTHYLVVWTDASRGGVVGRRLDALGNVVDPAPFFITAGTAPSVSALGENFLVAFTYAPAYQYQFTSAYVIRVDGNAGLPLGPAIMIGGSFAVSTHVVTVGDRWLALWQQNNAHNSQVGSCLGVFVAADGTLEDAIHCGGAGAYRKSPVAAVSDDTVLLVWAEGSHPTNYDIVARRMDFDGAFLDAQPFTVSNAASSQYAPAVAWNGEEFVVAFSDGRNRVGLSDTEDLRADLYGARVSHAGQVLDPTAFPIAAEPAQEQSVQVGVLGDDTMFSASLFIAEAPYAAYRVGTAYLYGEPGPNQPPVAALQALPSQGYAPLAVQFGSEGSYDPEGAPLIYAWNFGDGNDESGQEVWHTYTSPGTYVVTLTVSDPQGLRSSSSQTIVALQPNRPPVLTATCTPTTGTAPHTISVDAAGSYDPDGGSFSYWWDYGDGNGTAGASGTHIYATPGTYTVSITLTDPEGLSASNSFTVTVSPSVKTIRSSGIGLSARAILGQVLASGSVMVLDQNNKPVAGVSVAVQWTLPNGWKKSQEVKSNASGSASFSVLGKRGSYTLQVVQLAKPGYVFDATRGVLSRTIVK